MKRREGDVKIGRFDEYLSGKLEVQAGKETLFLDMNLQDKAELKAIIGEKKTKQEKLDAIKTIDTVLLNILKKSYPEETKEALEALYLAVGDELFANLLVKLGWMTDEKKKND